MVKVLTAKLQNMNIQEYYSKKIIQERIAQYCGSDTTNPGKFTAAYLVGLHESYFPTHGKYFFSVHKSEFPSLIEKGADIFRSVLDEKYMLFVIDIEYVNLDYPGEAFFNPGRAFTNLENIYLKITKLLNKFEIKFLTLMTGQGYHFVFKVPIDSKPFNQLYKIGKIESSLEGKYSSTHGRRTSIVTKEIGLAYDGIGRIIEYFVHLIFRNLKDYIGIPVTCFDGAIGKTDMIVFDLSMYGDPIYMRDIRCPFSVYQKHKLFKDRFGETTATSTPFFISLPRADDISLKEILQIRTDFDKSIEYAEKTSTEIPDASAGVLKLIKSYKSSKLRKFHIYFDSQEHDPYTIWHKTYDLLDLDQLPPCVSHCLKYPNDHLLKPTNIQAITRVLLKLNWHPKHIAGLIRSKYERNYNWGNMWFKYDAATRANLYVRVFSGMVITGSDKEEDLNCVSHKEKKFCLEGWNCRFNLADYRLSYS